MEIKHHPYGTLPAALLSGYQNIVPPALEGRQTGRRQQKTVLWYE
jgi:hypothetical protein